MHCKTVTILLRIRVRAHFVMSITKNHESYYVTAVDDPPYVRAHTICQNRPAREVFLVKLTLPWGMMTKLALSVRQNSVMRSI